MPLGESWKRRLRIGCGGIAALFLVLVLALVWFVRDRTGGHLVPPAATPGQPSVASYATEIPASFAERAPAVTFSWRTLAEPPASARPWTRWWWPGGDVEVPRLLEQLDELKAAGFGGVEIQPFENGMTTIRDEAVRARVHSFDSPEYYEKLTTVMAGAAERGMAVDLNHLSGWPPGGPQVTLGDSLQNLVVGEVEVRGGARLSLPLPRPRPGINEYLFSLVEFAGGDFVNFAVDHASLLSVLAVQKVSGSHAWSAMNLEDTVTLDPETTHVLGDHVADGLLVWDAPPGDWLVMAVYVMPSGETPLLVARDRPGYTVDHLRVPQVVGHYEYAYGPRTGLEAHYGRGLRGFFNDSLEFRLKRLGASDILEEFRARRGYDLEPLLPAVFVEGADNFYLRDIFGIKAAPEYRLTGLDDRIRHDYQLTLSDLMIERFVETSARWAEARGLVSRGQTYGMDLDVIRGLGANTIPETEQLFGGGSDIGLKLASSAAALYGRPLVSSESFVWMSRPYTTTARKIKAAADKLFLAGINHIVYHGTPYPWHPPEPSPFGEEGWYPFSGPGSFAHFSSNVSRTNPLWEDLKPLNTYIARAQSLLRGGRPATDVLVYYPFLGFPSSFGRADNDGGEPLFLGRMPDADPMRKAEESSLLGSLYRSMLPEAPEDERIAWLNALRPTLQELDRRGISWGWVNGHALQNGRVGVDRLTDSGGVYQAILLFDVVAIDAESLEALESLARAGVSVLVAGETPRQQPGFRDAEAGDRAVRARVQGLLGAGASRVEGSAAAVGDAVQSSLELAVRFAAASGLRLLRRHDAGGAEIYLFANLTPSSESATLVLTGEGPAWWFDAAEGVSWPVETPGTSVELNLGAYESRFLVLGTTLPPEAPRGVPRSVALEGPREVRELSSWTLELDGAGRPLSTLVDWRDDDGWQHARGPGLYRTTLELPSVEAAAQYLLDLGLVHGAASVIVNGHDIGRTAFHPFVVDISAAVRAGQNEIEVRVTPPLRNHLVGRALAGDPRREYMKAFADELVAAGLMGPVRVAVVARP